MRAGPFHLAAVHLLHLHAGYRAGVVGCSASVPVLRDVSLRVAAGASQLVHGAPGAGVTTLLHCAAGLRQPWRGSASAFGVPAARALRDGVLAFVPHAPVLYASFTVRDVLACAAARAAARADRECALGLELDRPVPRLTEAERWCAALAGALASGARLLVLDVPAVVVRSAAARHVLRRACALAAQRGGGALLGAGSGGALPVDRRLALAGGRVLAEPWPAGDGVARVAEARLGHASLTRASVDPSPGAS